MQPVMFIDGDISASDADKLASIIREWDDAPEPVVPDEQYQHLSELYHAQEKRLFKIAQRIKGPAFDKYAYSPSQAIDVLESAIFGEQEGDCAAIQSFGNSEQPEPVSNHDELNSPASPDGFVTGKFASFRNVKQH